MRDGLVGQRHVQRVASASEYTATEPMPSRRSVRMMRQAIAPRLAIRTFVNMRTAHRDGGAG